MTEPEKDATGGVSAAEEARVIALLCADVEATVGAGHTDRVVRAAAHCRIYNRDPARYAEEVVDDVQQYMHDTFVDTTWPACPHHPNHPMGLADGWWRCGRVQPTAIVPFGSLGTLEK